MAIVSHEIKAEKHWESAEQFTALAPAQGKEFDPSRKWMRSSFSIIPKVRDLKDQPGVWIVESLNDDAAQLKRDCQLS